MKEEFFPFFFFFGESVAGFRVLVNCYTEDSEDSLVVVFVLGPVEKHTT